MSNPLGKIVLYDAAGNPAEFPVEEVAQRLREGYGFRTDAPENAQRQRRVLAMVQGDDGSWRQVSLSPESAHELFQDPASGYVPWTREISESIAQGREVRDLSGMGIIQGLMSAGDTASLGLSALARRGLSGQSAEFEERVRGQNQTAATIGSFAGLGVSLAAGGIGAGASGAARGLQLAGPGAISMAAGSRAGAYITQALARAGVSQRAAGFAGQLGRGAVEGFVGNAALNLTDAVIENRELDAEQILGDGGLLGAGLGMAAEGFIPAFRGALRLARRSGRAVRSAATPGASLLNETRLERQAVAEAFEGDANKSFAQLWDEAQQSQITTTKNRVFRALNEIAAPVGGQMSPDLLNHVANDVIHRLAAQIDTLDTTTRLIADRLQMSDDIAEQALAVVNGERRFARYAADFGAMDVATVRAMSKQALDSLEARFRGVLEAPDAAKFGEARGLRTALRRIQEVQERIALPDPPAPVMSSILDEAGVPFEKPGVAKLPLRRTADELYRELDGLRAGLWDLSLKHKHIGEAQVMKQFTGDLRSFLQDEASWGRIGAEEGIRAQVMSRYLDARQRVIDRFGKRGVRTLREAGPSKDKLRGLYTQLQDVRADGIHADLEEYTEAGRDAIRALRGIEDINPRLLEDFERELLSLRQEMQRAADIVEAKGILDRAFGRENKASGFASALGIGGAGAALGFAAGGPLAAAAMGITSGVAGAVLTKPAGMYSRWNGMKLVFEKYAGRMDLNIGKFRLKLLEGGRAVGTGAQAGLRAMPLITLKLMDYRKEPETYRAVRDRIEGLAQNPEALVNVLGETGQPLYDVDPELAAYLQQTTLRGLQYLAMHLPPEVRDPLFPDRPGLLPSRTMMDSLLRRQRALEDPLSVMEDMVAGRVSHEATEAVRVVYPQIHADMASRIIETLIEVTEDDKVKIPHQTRQQLSTLFGISVALSLNGNFIGRAQRRFAQTPQQQQQIMGQSATPLRSAKGLFSSSTLTDTQRLLGE